MKRFVYFTVVWMGCLLIYTSAFNVCRESFIRNKKFIKFYCSDDKIKSPVSSLTKSMLDARNCESSRMSPGAGLPTADEQSDAAYADLINTSIDQRKLDISSEEIKNLEKGGTMWEKSSRNSPKMGIFGAAGELFKALSGGAHIEKNKFGET